MKLTLCYCVITSLLIFSCDERNLSECSTVDCIPSDINWSIQITLDFKNYTEDELKLIKVVQLNKIDQSPVDTVVFETIQDKKLYIGGEENALTFGEALETNYLEEVQYDFIIQLVELEKDISLQGIEVEEIKGECCDSYEIVSINLNSDVQQHNSSYIELEL